MNRCAPPTRRRCTHRPFLPGRPVTGLDIGCGTGRYTRLLRGLLPHGSLLAGCDLSAAMLAQLRVGRRGRAREVMPLLAAAEELPLRRGCLDLVTAFNCVHHFDLDRFLAAAARVLKPGGQLFIYTRIPQQNARRFGAATSRFTEHEQRLHSEAALRDAVQRADGLQMATTQNFQHQRTSTPSGSRPRPSGHHHSTFSFYPRKSCAQPSQHSWPACPASRSPGWMSTCWSSPERCGGNQAEPDGQARPATPAAAVGHVLTTERLVLRPVTAHDHAWLLAHWTALAAAGGQPPWSGTGFGGRRSALDVGQFLGHQALFDSDHVHSPHVAITPVVPPALHHARPGRE